MPIMDGELFIQKLRADPLLVALPVIMISARSLDVDKVSAFKHGVDDYLSKPFSRRELLARVKVR